MSARRKKNEVPMGFNSIIINEISENIPLYSIFNTKQMKTKYKNTSLPEIKQENDIEDIKKTDESKKSSRGKRVPLSPVNKSTPGKTKASRSSGVGSANRGVKRSLEDGDYVNTSGKKRLFVAKRDRPRRRIATQRQKLIEYSDSDELSDGENLIDNNIKKDALIGDLNEKKDNTNISKNQLKEESNANKIELIDTIGRINDTTASKIINDCNVTEKVISDSNISNKISPEKNNSDFNTGTHDEMLISSHVRLKLSSLFKLKSQNNAKSSTNTTISSLKSNRMKDKAKSMMDKAKSSKSKHSTMISKNKSVLKEKKAALEKDKAVIKGWNSMKNTSVHDSDFESSCLSSWCTQSNKTAPKGESELIKKTPEEPKEQIKKSKRIVTPIKWLQMESVSVTKSKKGETKTKTEKAGTLKKSEKPGTLQRPETAKTSLKKAGKVKTSKNADKVVKSPKAITLVSETKKVLCKLAPIFNQPLNSKLQNMPQTVKLEVGSTREQCSSSVDRKDVVLEKINQKKHIVKCVEKKDSPMSRFVYKQPIEATLPSWAEFKQVKLEELLAGRTWQGFNTQLEGPPTLIPIIPQKRENLNAEFHRIKSLVPTYPVYRCFKMMRERNGYRYDNPSKASSQASSCSSHEFLRRKEFAPTVETPTVDNMPWTEKYKPTCTDHIIGNAHVVRQLKQWLQKWVEQEESDVDYSESFSCPEKCIILRGCSGTGKTSAVYAIAEELEIKILEINASCKRSRKNLDKQLLEATQSHQVALRKNESGMCLLLIEDADLVFEEDEGFIKGLRSLVAVSKRPVIMITTDINVPHLEPYTSTYPVLTFFALSGGILGTYFQVLCLVEGLQVDLESIKQLLLYFKGDARRTTLQLQFWLQSGGDSVFQRGLSFFSNPLQPLCAVKEGEYDDFEDGLFLESQSGASSYVPVDSRVHSNAILSAMEYGPNQIFPRPLDDDVIWWNIPNVLWLEEKINDGNVKKEDQEETSEDHEGEKVVEYNDKVDGMKKLADLANFYDMLSYCDTFCQSLEDKCKEDSFSYWNDDNTNLDPGPSKHFIREGREDLKIYLMESAGRLLLDGREPGPWDFTKPSSDERKWMNHQQDCDAKFFEALPQHTRTNRRGFKLDYAPYLHNMAQAKMQDEKDFPKRHKRTKVYFEPLDILMGRKQLETACNPYSFIKSKDND